MTKFSASIALHGLSLAIACKVVRSATLVAGSRTIAACKTASRTAGETSAWWTSGATSSWCGVRGWTVALQKVSVGARASEHAATYCKMSGLAARVAASVRCTATQPQGWAVSLDMSKALAVIALLRCSLYKHVSSPYAASDRLLSVVLGWGQLLLS